MKTGTCLALLAIGAILAFAIRGHPSFLNVQVAGVVIMVIGAAGLVLPPRGTAWLRRQVVRRGPRGRVVGRTVETRTPSYVMLDPAAMDEVLPDPAPEDAAVVTETEDVSDTADLPVADDEAPDHVDRVRPAEREVVEEEDYFGDHPES